MRRYIEVCRIDSDLAHGGRQGYESISTQMSKYAEQGYRFLTVIPDSKNPHKTAVLMEKIDDV